MDFKYKRPLITPCQIDKNLVPDEPEQINVLIQMKNDNNSDYTINFPRKALTYLSEHTALSESEAVKLYISTLRTSDGYTCEMTINGTMVFKKHKKCYGTAVRQNQFGLGIKDRKSFTSLEL